MTPVTLTGVGRLVTNDPGRPGLLGVVERAALVIDDGRVGWAGEEADLPEIEGERIDLGGRAVLPGFVDSHTHLVFAGERAEEFGMRMGGATYEEILEAGGGIHSTVAATREAGVEELLAATRRRAELMLVAGTTTVEVKSGYGLDRATERRQLEVAARLGEELPLDVSPTFLAHVVPRGRDRGGYLEALVAEIIPTCAPLARFCDVFCDRGAFTVEEARSILEAGRNHGLVPKLHAEQLGRTGAARLAAELGAVSADHLDHVAPEDVELLRQAGTVAVLLPGVSLSLRIPQPPARMLWEAGVPVAIATDCNPGSSYVVSMPFVIAVAVLDMGLTPDEAVWAATRGGALALGLADRGALWPGAPADLVVLEADSHLHLAYRPDTPLVTEVWKSGVRVI